MRHLSYFLPLLLLFIFSPAIKCFHIATLIRKCASELAKKGGWHEKIDKKDENLPAWQRRGFTWTWQENGDLDVVHRVAGIYATI